MLNINNVQDAMQRAGINFIKVLEVTESQIKTLNGTWNYNQSGENKFAISRLNGRVSAELIIK
jgi:hypothetical protein